MTSPGAVNAQAPKDCRILVFGDSLSAAYGLKREEGWVHLLTDKLAAGSKKAFACSVHNASISGETTAGGKSRLPAVVQAQRPTLVVIELGANDGLRGLPIDAMKANLQAMIDEAKSNQAKVLLIGMKMPPNYGRTYTQAFEESFVQLARQNKIALVPFLFEGFADQAERFQKDGIHPNAQAQPLLLNNVWPALEKLL